MTGAPSTCHILNLTGGSLPKQECWRWTVTWMAGGQDVPICTSLITIHAATGSAALQLQGSCGLEGYVRERCLACPHGRCNYMIGRCRMATNDQCFRCLNRVLLCSVLRCVLCWGPPYPTSCRWRPASAAGSPDGRRTPWPQWQHISWPTSTAWMPR